MEYVVIAFIFICLTVLILGILIPIYKEHDKATGKIVNYDCHMQRFVYKVPAQKTEILERLSKKCEVDELCCDIDKKTARW